MKYPVISTKGPTFKEGGRGRSKAQKRLALFRLQCGKCAICNAQMSLATCTLDHIIPRGMGGGNKMNNLRVTHASCNSARGCSMADVFVHAAGMVALRWNIKEIP